MQVREYDADDAAAVETGRLVLNAERAVDAPWLPELTPLRRTLQVRSSWDGSPVRHRLAFVDGVAVAVASVEVGEWDNRDLGWIDLRVHPAHRRRGHGTALLAVLEEEVRDQGGTKVGMSGWDTPACRGFAAARGYRHASQEVQRVLRPRSLPPGFADAAYAEAVVAAGDYELLRVAGRTPEDLLPGLVALHSAINDAPSDDLDIEDEVFPVERIRAYEEAQTASHQRLYRVLARHRETWELVGHTVVAVDEERPAIAHQHDTSVLRDHRGHRLGLLLKAEMMRWLAEVEPQITSLDTWNAESNDHMITVNERLGYVATGTELEFQRRL